MVANVTVALDADRETQLTQLKAQVQQYETRLTQGQAFLSDNEKYRKQAEEEIERLKQLGRW